MLSQRNRQLADVFEDIENAASSAKLYAENGNLLSAFLYLREIEKLVEEATERVYYEIRKDVQI